MKFNPESTLRRLTIIFREQAGSSGSATPSAALRDERPRTNKNPAAAGARLSPAAVSDAEDLLGFAERIDGFLMLTRFVERLAVGPELLHFG
ncbi:MAG: hypothetical protein JWO70_554 [Betaproteobacteria bacterium]|nr:hypothetical protein [Betaproteobacteria bacterium]